MSETDTHKTGEQPTVNTGGIRRKGSPPWKPIDERRVEVLAAQGLSDEQIAAALGINFKTLLRRKQRFEEFRAVMERGKALGIAQVANVLFQKATVDKDVTAMIFFLKCRAKWQDRVAVDIEHHADGDIQELASLVRERRLQLAGNNGHVKQLPEDTEMIEFEEATG